MSNLKTILDRLVQENLHGPIEHRTQDPSRQHPSKGQGPVDDEQEDLDAHDPRWRQLFQDFFISEHSDDRNDDLLFFVQRPSSLEAENGGLGVDPVFVKRKVKGLHHVGGARTAGRGGAASSVAWQQLLTIEQEKNVLWKDTFFLNVIVQLPCKMTVAICSRISETNPVTGITKTSMTCTRKHVTKRVYALPTKSRVDVKEATVECSWPLIYYVIDDYEDAFDQLMLRENEHLCVELYVTLPSSPSTAPTSPRSRSHFQETHWSHPAGNDGLQIGKPFPSAPGRGANKITLFQGAVGFKSLLGIYQQKAASKVGRRFKFGPHSVPTEFIIMRGPGARGHAQVAITASNLGDEDTSPSEANPTSPTNGQAPTWNEKNLPTIPSINGSTTGTMRTNGHGYASQRDSEKLAINTSPLPLPPPSSSQQQLSPKSPSSPSKSFSTGTFFQSLRRISMATLAQAASTATGTASLFESSPSSNASRSQTDIASMPPGSAGSAGNQRPPSTTSSGFTSINRDGNGSTQEGGVNSAGIGTRQEVEALVKSPQSLRCCMTFVNVPWTGIATLLMDHAYQRNHEK
ncbi:hypothetical protein BGX31_010514 [Mortierella sp. GBA43]|nr:hypothetical protein BGX31_010514 [Mortierella sp. GBA43]